MQNSLQCAKTAVKFRKIPKMQKLEETMEEMEMHKTRMEIQCEGGVETE